MLTWQLERMKGNLILSDSSQDFEPLCERAVGQGTQPLHRFLGPPADLSLSTELFRTMW